MLELWQTALPLRWEMDPLPLLMLSEAAAARTLVTAHSCFSLQTRALAQSLLPLKA